MVEGEGGGGGAVVVLVVAERVVLADDYLEYDSVCTLAIDRRYRDPRTSPLLPGSLTVANCSSLYFLKAGSRFLVNCGSSIVSALMSECVRKSAALSTEL